MLALPESRNEAAHVTNLSENLVMLEETEDV